MEELVGLPFAELSRLEKPVTIEKHDRRSSIQVGIPPE
jgi:hypothetical protein